VTNTNEYSGTCLARVLVLYVVCGIVVLKGSGWEGVEESVSYD